VVPPTYQVIVPSFLFLCAKEAIFVGFLEQDNLLNLRQLKQLKLSFFLLVDLF